MSLTPGQKECGRAFREWCQNALLNGITADAFCSPFTVWYRHECKPSDRAVQAGTWAMQLRQTYCLSPACDAHGVPDGLFAYIYRFGECPRCELRVLSGSARFVLAAQNPPEKGAHVAKQPAHRVVPEDQASPPQPR